MSADPRENDGELAEEIDSERLDGSTVLSQRAAMGLLLSDPDVRGYTFAALGALGMILLVMFQKGSDIGGILIALIGGCGLLFRWAVSPAIVLIVLTYFVILPLGLPVPMAFDAPPDDLPKSHFRPEDIILVFSVLLYVVSHFRLLGVASHVLPFENSAPGKGETPARRPPALISTSEVGRMLALSAALVVVGQLIWLVASRVEVVPGATFPFKWVKAQRVSNPFEAPEAFSLGSTRFLVLVGLLFFVTVLGRLVFGYWRLRTMGADEGAMILLDGGWSETRRERSRQEKWRAWGRKRTKTGEKP